MPFRTALSGLNAAASELKVIGNNVANASTTGFKESRAEFADVFASSNLGVSSNAIGRGVRVAAVSQQFSQGNVAFTDNNLDLAISGQGFFVVSDGGVNTYTRSGQFGVDRDGFVVNSSAQRLVTFGADETGNITGATSSLKLDNSDINPQSSEKINVSANLDASADIPGGLQATDTFALTPGTQLDTTAGVYVTPNIEIYDQQGNNIPDATLQFTYTGTGADWNVEMLVGGASTSPATTATNVSIGTDTIVLNWDPDGTAAQKSTAIELSTRSISSTNSGGSTVTAAANGSSQTAFDPTDATTYNNSTSLTVYDSLGTAHLSTMYFRKTGIPNQWESYMYVDGAKQTGPDTLEFSSTGEIQNTSFPSKVNVPAFDPGGGAAPMDLEVSFGNSTQFGSPFNVNALTQDGFPTGRLSGLEIGDTGVITSNYTNGQTRVLGQVALANFANTQGLTQNGGTSWSETFDSGAPLVSAPGSGALGLVESGALEDSNVDLTKELVGMITAQRNFQANAQVITTADAITQTIINIR
ncbi:MAG: flagellar hook protein FlgE [Gammaproteobacteria bacterium]